VAYLFSFPQHRKKGAHMLGDASAAPDGSEDALYLHDMAVRPSRQRRGLSQLLLQHANKLCRDMKLTWQTLTAVHWKGAPEFWQKQGFRALSTFPYSLKPSSMQASFMEKQCSGIQCDTGSTAASGSKPAQTQAGTQQTQTAATDVLRAADIAFSEHHFEYEEKGGTARSSSLLVSRRLPPCCPILTLIALLLAYPSCYSRLL
jgi:hypothetical protein